MGLFTNSKKGCPVCGSATPKLFPTKVDGTPICKVCSKKIFLPDGKLKEMSVDDFLQYMNFYEENQKNRDLFFETYKYDAGLFGEKFIVDTAHGLFRKDVSDGALVFEAAHLKSIRILEDDKPLFEGQKGSFKKIKSDVPEKAERLRNAAAMFRIQYMEYEQMEQMQREREERARERGETITTRYISRPTFESGLFKTYIIELTLDHPYWSEMRWEVTAPSFDSERPSVDDYLRDYENKVEEFRALAVNVMQLIDPNAQMVSEGENNGTAAVQQTPVVNGVEEIKKYKELLDMGIITEEEFAVKKHELLGL